MLGLEYERIHIDSPKGATQTEAFRRLNPRGQIPVLADDGTVVWDSMAILVYLARKYGDENWLPRDALGETRVMQWLAVAENELLYGLARARMVKLFDRPFDLEQCQAEGRAGLSVLEAQLGKGQWLANKNLSIADLACYPYVALAPEAGVALEAYPNVMAWLRRIEAAPGYMALLD